MTPAETLRKILEYLEDEDWDGAIALHSREYIEAEVSSMLLSVRPPRRIPTVEGLMRSDPTMPRVVAEYEVESARRAPQPNAFFGDLFGIESEEDLEGMSPREIYARYLHGRDYRWRWRDHIAALGARHPLHREALEAQLARSPSPWRVEVIGQVVDGSRAYVLFGSPRNLDEHAVDHPPSVAVFRLTAKGWRLSSDIVPGHVLSFGPVRVPDGDGGWVTLT